MASFCSFLLYNGFQYSSRESTNFHPKSTIGHNLNAKQTWKVIKSTSGATEIRNKNDLSTTVTEILKRFRHSF